MMLLRRVVSTKELATRSRSGSILGRKGSLGVQAPRRIRKHRLAVVTWISVWGCFGMGMNLFYRSRLQVFETAGNLS
jgi:hypothetical protein